MHSKDLENIFVMCMLSMDLCDNAKKGSIFTKKYAYSFTMDEAVHRMGHMEVEICTNSTTTTISCDVKQTSVYVFLHRFMMAKLIHCPADRTRQEPKSSVVMQPTAKGVYIMSRYCRRNGIQAPRGISKLWKSNYNTMQCVALERDPQTDQIIQSDAFIYLLFQKMLGGKPNIYTAMGQPECASSSPYAHRYFTHPESDSLSQYYVSTSGVRVFNNREINGKRYDYVVTGRACWQWLMECTDVIQSSEAVALANLFISHGLIKCLTSDQPGLHKDTLYGITQIGRRLSQWQGTSRKVKNLNLSKKQQQQEEEEELPSRFAGDLRSPTAITLREVLQDAGLRFLFKEHLNKDYCEENLLFFTDLKHFLTMSDKQSLLLNSKTDGDLVTAAYAIYNRYIASGAPLEINIDHILKSKLVGAMELKPSSERVIRDSVAPLFDEAMRHVYKMMEQDSLPKFVRSEEFKAKVQAIAPWYF